MRRLKAIYLILIFGVLWIGAGIAAYFMLLSPQIEKTKKASAAWLTAKQAMVAAEQAASTANTSYRTNAAKLIENYRLFKTIQASMPAVYNMKSYYAGRERDALRDLYLQMCTGKLARELDVWTKPFHLKDPPKYEFTGILGYEDTLTDVKLVSIPFGVQTMEAYGFADLIAQIRNRFGYKHFPLQFTGASAPADTAAASGGKAGQPGGKTLPMNRAAAQRPGTAAAPFPPAKPGAPAARNPGTGLAVQRLQATLPKPPGLGPSTGPGLPRPPGAAPAGATPPGSSKVAPSSPKTGASAATPQAAAGATPGAGKASGAAGTTDAAFTITVDRTKTRHSSAKPALVMRYDVTGAFFTRGWDPNSYKGDGTDQDLKNAKIWMVNPPTVSTRPTPAPYPLILGFFGGREDVKD